MSSKKSKQDTNPDLPSTTTSAAPEPMSKKKGTDWESGKHSVEKLSLHTKNRIRMNGHNPFNEKGPGPMHRAADMLHGWSWYRHNYAKPVELSKQDYLAAIKAAGSFNRHPAAIAPEFKPPVKD